MAFGDARPIGYQEKGSNVVSRWMARRNGIFLMIGGGLWVAWTIMHAMEPEGCVGAECSLPGRHMREGGTLDNALIIVVLLTLIAGVIGLFIQARATGRMGRLGKAGLVVSGAGAAVLLVSNIVVNLILHVDFAEMPLLVLPSVAALGIGFILLAGAILRTGLLPRWTAVVLIIGALSFIGADEQNLTILRAIPFGLAWLVVGYVLQFRGRSGQPKAANIGESVAARG